MPLGQASNRTLPILPSIGVLRSFFGPPECSRTEIGIRPAALDRSRICVRPAGPNRQNESQRSYKMRHLAILLCVAIAVFMARDRSLGQVPASPATAITDDGQSIDSQFANRFFHYQTLPDRAIAAQSNHCNCCGDNGNCACHGSYKYPVPS